MTSACSITGLPLKCRTSSNTLWTRAQGFRKLWAVWDRCLQRSGGSLREQNDNLHGVARIAYPFWLNECQIVEFGMMGYTGRYTVLSSTISPLGVGPAVRPLGTLETNGIAGIQDERLGWTFVYYPQPFGFQAEWNVGRGPLSMAHKQPSWKHLCMVGTP